MDPEILWDGNTVWVNGDGGLLGRFSRRGIDVHRTATEQMSTGIQCLDCSSIPDWRAFCSSMRKHHQVDVPGEARPSWVRDPARNR